LLDAPDQGRYDWASLTSRRRQWLRLPPSGSGTPAREPASPVSFVDPCSVNLTVPAGKICVDQNTSVPQLSTMI